MAQPASSRGTTKTSPSYASVYRKIADQNAESIAQLIRHLSNGDGQNLVLLSLVEKGTFAVAQLLGIPTDPWERIFTGIDSDHPIAWLDGSVPPLLREGYSSFVKVRLKKGQPATLLTTQVVEAGVDLDFETGFTDLLSIASTLQRGGRVARESRSDGQHRQLHVFNFETIINKSGVEVERTTKEILDRVAVDSLSLTEKAKQKISLLLSNTQYATRNISTAGQSKRSGERWNCWKQTPALRPVSSTLSEILPSQTLLSSTSS